MARAPHRRETSASQSIAANVLPATNKSRIHPYSPVLPDAPASATAWPVKDLCNAYQWPGTPKGGQKLDGRGTIAIIALGGGWVPSDVDDFFDAQDLKGLAPHITDHSVDGATKNSNCDPPSEADSEVALDIQLAAAAYAVATGKPATIRVYWAQGVQGAIAGVRAATTDECDVCCITWGADEQTWGEDAAWAFEQAAEAATAAGMVVFAASGDNDSSDGAPTPANVDLPASAPHVIACGGTTKPRDDKEKEKVWNDTLGDPSGRGTGGGFSTIFRIPAWQIGTLQAEMRMVPDVAANADPNVGYEIYVNKSARIVGGTSAAAALYTGLFASFTPKLGFIIPELYKNQVCFNDIQEGDNGQFRALVGPDACTGLGSPKASRLWNVVGSPLVTYQRRLREKDEEISRLRAGIAPCSCQSAPYDKSGLALRPRLAPAGATKVACPRGGVDPGTANPGTAAIRRAVLNNAAPGVDQSQISDQKPIAQLMPSSTNPIPSLAGEIMNDFPGLRIEPEDLIALGRNITVGQVVSYVYCCFLKGE